MYTLNIFFRRTATNPNPQYYCSISQNTRKECVAIAKQKYEDMDWAWDYHHYIKNKKFFGDPSTTVVLNLPLVS